MCFLKNNIKIAKTSFKKCVFEKLTKNSFKNCVLLKNS